jgi:hypothetical protein
VLLEGFLCSRENTVRNLQTGWSAAAEFGSPTGVGYLPDMFRLCAHPVRWFSGTEPDR